jgi:hypothetical protein
MPILAEDLQQLLAVQSVDSRIDHARKEQANLDDGSALAAAYNIGKTAFDRLRTEAMHAQANQQDAELKLQSIETKAKAVDQKRYGGTALGARELQDLNSQAEMLWRQKDDAEEKTLVAMEAASEALAKAKAAETELLSLSERYKKVRAAYKERHAALAAEIAATEKERAEVIKPVTPTILARYDAIRARRGGVGIGVLSADNQCGACHTQVSSGIAGDARAAKSPQTCEHCGRLLVPTATLA